MVGTRLVPLPHQRQLTDSISASRKHYEAIVDHPSFITSGLINGWNSRRSRSFHSWGVPDADTTALILVFSGLHLKIQWVVTNLVDT